MKYICDCGVPYSSTTALLACQTNNHGHGRKPAPAPIRVDELDPTKHYLIRCNRHFVTAATMMDIANRWPNAQVIAVDSERAIEVKEEK